jgi:hypothetical protein
MTTPVPRVPEALLDGKTFTFIQYVPILATVNTGASISVKFNTSPNGFEYQIITGTDTPFVFGQLWGEALQQFAPLAALYETYTILDVSVQATPSYPGLVYGTTPGIWAIQTAESRTNFINGFELASQFNATLT